METTEHITESYVRYCLNWFTNSNIKAKGGKEIDILAMDKDGNKYWIECGVTHKKHWSLKARATEKDFQEVSRKEGSKRVFRHGNSVDYFVEKKFNDPRLKEKIKEFGFSGENYKKIIVCWQVKDDEVKRYAKKKGIEIWELKEKMKKLRKKLGETYYSDDILRTLQLVNKLDEEG